VRALDQPVVEHRDLEPRNLQAIREQANEPAQALGRDEHERAKPPRLVGRTPGERRDAIQRDQRLADAGLAVDDERGVRAEVDRALLLGIEHHERAAIRNGARPRRRPHARLLAIAIDGDVVADQGFERAAALQQPALADPALGDPIAGLEFVGLAGRGAKERLGQRRVAPVQHRRRRVGLRARTDHVRPLAAVGLDDEKPARGGHLGKSALDLGEPLHRVRIAHPARPGKLVSTNAVLLRSSGSVRTVPLSAR